MTTDSSSAITALHPEAVTATQAVIPPEGVVDLVTQMYGALADPTRVRILRAGTTVYYALDNHHHEYSILYGIVPRLTCGLSRV